MKARVKATGEIKEVTQGIYSPYQYVDNEGTIYTENDIEELPGDDGTIFFDTTIDYWTRLEQQYAGMAMQALLLTNNIRNGDLEGMRECNTNALAIAYALVEKLKEKEERK